MKCPLCNNSKVKQRELFPQFYNCNICGTVFRSSQFFLSSEKEKQRYLLHENDVEDLGYQKFVGPLVDKVSNVFSSRHIGLDFGAGTGPVAAKLLTEKGLNICLWDPFFHPDHSVLKNTYDYIICCEVIEHFHNPQQEFKKLKALLKPQGKLYCMTEFLPEIASFKNWHYKNDKTHVIFYSAKNLIYIQEKYGFSDLELTGRRLAVFSN